MNPLDSWLEAACAELGLGADDVPKQAVLDLARDVAHQVVRPGAPLTAYLMGLAVGRGARPSDVATRLSALALAWPDEQSGAGEKADRAGADEKADRAEAGEKGEKAGVDPKAEKAEGGEARGDGKDGNGRRAGGEGDRRRDQADQRPAAVARERKATGARNERQRRAEDRPGTGQ